jgi:hypothetical protein
MPNQLPAMVEERIVSFAIAHPGLGPKRIASELGRAKRLSLVAGYRAPTSRRGHRSPSRTSRSTTPVSWSASTASTSAA